MPIALESIFKSCLKSHVLTSFQGCHKEGHIQLGTSYSIRAEYLILGHLSAIMSDRSGSFVDTAHLDETVYLGKTSLLNIQAI